MTDGIKNPGPSADKLRTVANQTRADTCRNEAEQVLRDGGPGAVAVAKAWRKLAESYENAGQARMDFGSD